MRGLVLHSARSWATIGPPAPGRCFQKEVVGEAFWSCTGGAGSSLSSRTSVGHDRATSSGQDITDMQFGT